MVDFQSYNKSFINGEWVKGGASKRTYQNINPYDQTILQEISIATADQLAESFRIAKESQKQWAMSTADERKEVLRKVSGFLKDHREEIIEIIIRETGGSYIKANVEIDLTVDLVEEAVHMADQLGESKEVDALIEGKRNKVFRLPLGVITSISPFNFPMNLSMRTIAPAIALGNSVVHKPDIQTAMTGGVIIAKAFEDAGLPKGIFNCILTDLEEIGMIC
ncbi:aldehyde dehydrogenase [Gracilibacillus boraciitolerans JCM 21714]|uniref:Aldehyde dehydrogenase n=1 Tax=Gracilibacillus boraciitolerans JCM 21714 TaxID=1298598 RepID=W4VML7_9BACI|nr:aldehyde dehydrogenase [Gracilibacillus boraciitolerans JCM 21714]